MRLTILMSLTVLALTGCFEEEEPAPPPPPSAKASPAKTVTKTVEAEPTPEPSPAPVERSPEPQPTEVSTPKPKPKKPMNLLSRTKVELEKVDEEALKKKPTKVADRTAEAERKARASSGKSAWKPRTKRAPRKRIPPKAGPLERAKPTGENRDVIRSWTQAGRLLGSGTWGAYFKLHTPAIQKSMLASAVERLFSYALQRSELLARKGIEPNKYRRARQTLQRYGVKARSLKLTTTGTGMQMAYRPPAASTVVAQIRNTIACYQDLMSARTISGGSGAHRGLYVQGDLAGLVIQGDRARAAILEANGRARYDIFFRKSGRTWLLASLATRR